MEKKIQQLLQRLGEVEGALGHPEVFQDQKQYRALTQEHAYLNEVKTVWNKILRIEKQLEDNRNLLKEEKDPEFAQILRDDSAILEAEAIELKQKIENLLIPPEPTDHQNTILELRAGTGGEEAALFVADCVRMYKLYADKKGWKYEVLSCTPSEKGGFREYVMVLSGENVYRVLRHEAGTHRVQRVPETEAQGRVHTSAITVAALLEPEEGTEDIDIDERDLRIDTYRSSGAGGQHVNVTDSAVRITHIPSGLVVASQEERSQHKNKAKAMRLLKAKLIDLEAEKQRAAMASTRSNQVGSGDRSERIRTYNFSQNRVTDHRINLTRYNLDLVMNGHMDEFSNALVAHYHHQRLNAA
jgi:peptide chain release factor 1